MPLTIAIVGRPNVGKSSIFNRLVGRRLAIVHDTPGVTRDRSIAETVFNGLDLRVVDTAGFEGKGGGESISGRMADQTLTAIDDADVLLFILDGREGLTEADKAIARTLRKSGKTVILAANKCEGRTDLAEMHGLGFGELLELSAEHALGFADLAEVLAPLAPRAAVPNDEEDEAADEIGEEQEEQDEDYTSRPLRLALVGRPNVGKSSLFNRLLGDERSIVGPEAGLTRDAIVAPWKAGERDILLHDTAGLRKKARVAGEVLEGMSVSSTVEAIRFADCVIVMIDANQPFEKQDLAIADLIAREGRAIVFAVNKWDLKEEKNGAISELREKLDRLLPQVAGAALVAVSAKTGQGLDRLVPAVIAADKAWNSRAPTAALNRFLESALLRHATPAVSGRRVKIRYMTQIKSRPPTFTLFGNQLDALPESYARYLTNGLREAFDLKGTPLRLLTRNTKNPYDTKK